MKSLFIILVLGFSLNIYAKGLHIIGDDSRVQIVDSSKSYFRSVGLVTSGCSGTLISSRHVLTAAHCIYNNKTKKFRMGHGFIPGAVAEGVNPFGSYNWNKVMLLNEYVQNDENKVALDYAVIELSESVESYDPDLIKFINAEEIEDKVFTSVSINGYPGEKESNTLWKDQCKTKNRIEENLSYICDSTKGMSGSGIIYHKSETENILLAVNSGGRTIRDYLGNTRIFNNGVKINKNIYDQILSWMDGTYKEETHVLENIHNTFNFIIKSNCDGGLKVFVAEEQDKALGLLDFTLVDTEHPYTFKSSKKDIFVRGEFPNNSGSYFGSYEYVLLIDSKKKPAYKTSINSGVYGSIVYTLNCN